MNDYLSNEMFTGQNYKLLFSQVQTPVAIYQGRSLIYAFVNEAYSQIFNGREIMGKTVREAFPELEGQSYFEILENVFDSGEPFYGNETPALIDRYNNGTLTTRYYNLVYTPLRNATGEIQGVMAMGHDVTEMVEARNKTEMAEANARLAIESADLGTYEVDLATSDIVSSPRFNAIFGFDRAVERSRLAASIHPDDRDIRERAHDEALLSGHLHYEARVVWEDNSEHWIKVNGKLLYNQQNQPSKLLGVVQEITEQKLFEERLSRKVEERTRALQEANARLERSNEDLEQFAYATSHDLQEPLRKIRIFNSMLLNDPDLKEDSRKNIQKVSEAATRMAGLINELLEYSKLSETTRYERVDLNVILRNVLSDFELLIAQKKAVITSEPLMSIEANPLQMNQLFYNLIGNSLKFAVKDTSPVISITSNILPDEDTATIPHLKAGKEYCELQFRDNGIGFNEENAEKMFAIFQRLNHRSLYAGYGIGLALCRKITEGHHGFISAEGKEGVGANFKVVLPVAQDH